ncbi:MAG TPA: hypothetical protein VIF62_13460 [Labilithrix sp.]
MKKIAAVLSAFMFVLVGCAADTNDPGGSKTGEEDLSIGGGGSFGTKAGDCRRCKNDCDDSYPNNHTGPWQTCMDLCNKGACAPSVAGSYGGAIAY